MYRSDMVKIIKEMLDAYNFDEIKKAHKWMKRIFGFAWCGAVLKDSLTYEYNIIDDDGDICHIYADWWNGIVE